MRSNRGTRSKTKGVCHLRLSAYMNLCFKVALDEVFIFSLRDLLEKLRGARASSLDRGVPGYPQIATQDPHICLHRAVPTSSVITRRLYKLRDFTEALPSHYGNGITTVMASRRSRKRHRTEHEPVKTGPSVFDTVQPGTVLGTQWVC